jgi:glyoxylase-like metal-dependent hydrolase (beta-lactamase superfamily II)
MTTFLIDGETSLDAGCLTETLPPAAQRRIRRVVLTHAHFDHLASLPLLMENLYGRAEPLEIAAPRPVLAAIRRHSDDRIWPIFPKSSLQSKPTIRFKTIVPDARTRGVSPFMPFAVSRVVPAWIHRFEARSVGPVLG